MFPNGEVSANFITSFSGCVEVHQLTLNQIFSCDETGLNCRLLPDNTLVASFEKKKAEQRHNQCLHKCWIPDQVTSPGYWQSETFMVF